MRDDGHDHLAVGGNSHLFSNRCKRQAPQNQISNSAVQRDNLRSQQIQQRALRAIQEDQRQTSDLIVNGYNQRQAVYHEISRKRENAILALWMSLTPPALNTKLTTTPTTTGLTIKARLPAREPTPLPGWDGAR